MYADVVVVSCVRSTPPFQFIHPLKLLQLAIFTLHHIQFSHRKQPKGTLPSMFLQKQETQTSKRVVYTFDRDIICLPKSYVQCDGFIQIPRKKDDRKFLVANKLIGKVRLRSDMEQDEIFDEIRSVFKSPMNYNDNFRFIILQTSGGDSKGLMIPELSTSYRWTATAIAGKNAKVPIYILADDDLLVCFR